MKQSSKNFGSLEYKKPSSYRVWNLGGGAALLIRANEARNLQVGIKSKKSEAVIYISKKR